MGRILRQMYAGELNPSENKIIDNPQYNALCAQVLDEMDAFTRELDKDMQKRFEAIMEGHLELASIEKSQCFSDGFSLGAGVMLEVLGCEPRSRFSSCA